MVPDEIFKQVMYNEHYTSCSRLRKLSNRNKIVGVSRVHIHRATNERLRKEKDCCLLRDSPVVLILY